MTAALSLAACCFALCAATMPARASSVWTQVYGGDKHSVDVAYAAVPDGRGGVVVTGESTTSNHHVGMATVDYDSSGNQVWSHSETVPYVGTYLSSSHVALDSTGDATVTGMSQDTDNQKLVVATYQPDGARTRRLELSPPYPESTLDGLQVYDNGDFSVEGGDVVTDSQTGLRNRYWLVARYDAMGDLLWSDNYSPVASNSSGLFNVAVGGTIDNEGNLVVGGTVTPFASSPAISLAVRKYASDGTVETTTIVPQRSGDSAAATAIAFDADYNVYLAAEVYGITSSSPAGSRIAAAKFTSGDGLVWQHNYGNDGDYAIPTSIAVDADGSVIAGGSLAYYGAHGGTSYSEALLVKWDANGSLVWARGQHKVPSGDNSVLSVFAAPQTGEIWAVDRIETYGNSYSSKMAVDKYAADSVLESMSYYDGSAYDPDYVIVGGGAYDPVTNSLFAIGTQNDYTTRQNGVNYNWYTQKY